MNEEIIIKNKNEEEIANNECIVCYEEIIDDDDNNKYKKRIKPQNNICNHKKELCVKCIKLMEYKQDIDMYFKCPKCREINLIEEENEEEENDFLILVKKFKKGYDKNLIQELFELLKINSLRNIWSITFDYCDNFLE